MERTESVRDESLMEYHRNQIDGTSDEAVMLLAIGDLAEILHNQSPLLRRQSGINQRTIEVALKALTRFQGQRLEAGVTAVLRLFLELFRGANWVSGSVRVALNGIQQDVSLSSETRRTAQAAIEELGWPLG